MRTLIHRIQAFFGSKGFLLTLALLSMGSVIVYAENDRTPSSQPNAEQSAYLTTIATGVKAYREGDYLQAYKVFGPLHGQHPENSRITYYLAITQAQLGRFQQAKQLYQETLTLDPNGDAAKLAAEGLTFLPTEANLDLPPRFQGNSLQSAKQSEPSGNGQAATTGATVQAGPSISPQDWMAMQMMMGQNGMMGSGGMNAMPWMMTPGANGTNNNGTSGMGTFDPNMMSTMMMNQMMQNMTMSGNSSEENR